MSEIDHEERLQAYRNAEFIIATQQREAWSSMLETLKGVDPQAAATGIKLWEVIKRKNLGSIPTVPMYMRPETALPQQFIRLLADETMFGQETQAAQMISPSRKFFKEVSDTFYAWRDQKDLDPAEREYKEARMHIVDASFGLARSLSTPDASSKLLRQI